MTLLAAFGQRIRSEETTQLLALLLALLSVTLIVSWPTVTSPVNDSWASVSIVRRVVLLLCALYWAAGRRHATVRAQLLSALLLLCFTLLSAPLEVAALAASVPLAPLAPVLLLGFAAPLAAFGFTLLLVRACRRIRLGWLALPLALLGLAGFTWLDLRFDLQLFNLLQSGGSWPAALLAAGAALLTLALLFGSERRSGSPLRAPARNAA